MRSVVVLPAPFGPRKPVTVPRVQAEGQVVDRENAAEPLRQALDGDDLLTTVDGEVRN